MTLGNELILAMYNFSNVAPYIFICLPSVCPYIHVGLCIYM